MTDNCLGVTYKAQPPESASEQKVLALLGLATRAGKTVSGYQAVVDIIKRKTALLILVAEDASPSTIKKIETVALQYERPYYLFSNRVLLSQYLGKADRAVAAVTDANFARGMIELLEERKNGNINLAVK